MAGKTDKEVTMIKRYFGFNRHCTKVQFILLRITASPAYTQARVETRLGNETIFLFFTKIQFYIASYNGESCIHARPGVETRLGKEVQVILLHITSSPAYTQARSRDSPGKWRLPIHDSNLTFSLLLTFFPPQHSFCFVKQIKIPGITKAYTGSVTLAQGSINNGSVEAHNS